MKILIGKVVSVKAIDKIIDKSADKAREYQLPQSYMARLLLLIIGC
ncbi:hypothetical protein MT390_05020 [Vibrio sp. 2-Bac 85]